MADDPFKGPAFYKRWWWQLRFSNPLARRRRARAQLRLVGEDGQLVPARKRPGAPVRGDAGSGGSPIRRLARWARTKPFELILVLIFMLLATRYVLMATGS